MFKLTPNMFNNKTMKNFLKKTKTESRPKSSNSFFVMPRKYIPRTLPPLPNKKKPKPPHLMNYLHFMRLPNNQFTKKGESTYKMPNYSKNRKNVRIQKPNKVIKKVNLHLSNKNLLKLMVNN